MTTKDARTALTILILSYCFSSMNIVILSLELVGLPPVISAGVSYCVSTVFNYVASMRYVFAHREGLSRTREFIIFVTLSVIGLGLNEAIMWLGGCLVGEEWYMLTKVVGGCGQKVGVFRQVDLSRRRHFFLSHSVTIPEPPPYLP